MKDEEVKIAKAFAQCADVRLPDGFADRLVARLVELNGFETKNTSLKKVFSRMVLVAASLTLLLGFVPVVMDRSPDRQAELVAAVDEIRPLPPQESQEGQFNALALLGFCREVIRRRVRLIFERSSRRDEE